MDVLYWNTLLKWLIWGYHGVPLFLETPICRLRLKQKRTLRTIKSFPSHGPLSWLLSVFLLLPAMQESPGQGAHGNSKPVGDIFLIFFRCLFPTVPWVLSQISPSYKRPENTNHLKNLFICLEHSILQKWISQSLLSRKLTAGGPQNDDWEKVTPLKHGQFLVSMLDFWGSKT